MSLDSSLKTSGNLTSHRNVLKGHERIEKLKDSKEFDAKTTKALGLRKTISQKIGK